MHAAKLANNGKLQKLHAALKERSLTTRQIRDLCDSCSPATLVSELRHNGIAVTARFQRMTYEGARVYVYSLDNQAPAEAAGNRNSGGLSPPEGKGMREPEPGRLFSCG